MAHSVNSSRIEGQRLETGTATLTVNNTSVETVHINFARSFSAPPKVVVTDLDGTINGEAFESTRIYNVTATGFDVEFKSLSGAQATGNADFGYYALGQ